MLPLKYGSPEILITKLNSNSPSECLKMHNNKWNPTNKKWTNLIFFFKSTIKFAMHFSFSNCQTIANQMMCLQTCFSHLISTHFLKQNKNVLNGIYSCVFHHIMKPGLNQMFHMWGNYLNLVKIYKNKNKKPYQHVKHETTTISWLA